MTTIIPKHLNKSLSVHTFTYFYKCSDKTYYGLFQYLAEKQIVILRNTERKNVLGTLPVLSTHSDLIVSNLQIV